MVVLAIALIFGSGFVAGWIARVIRQRRLQARAARRSITVVITEAEQFVEAERQRAEAILQCGREARENDS